MSEPQSESEGIVELQDTQLSDVQGGLLLPAVQKVREAASRLKATADGSAVGSVDPG